MEPPELNSSPPPPDPLETLLRNPARDLPDDGFSHRVLAALPARSRALPARWSFVAGGAFVGLVFASLRAGFSPSALSPNLDQLLAALAAAGGALDDPIFGFGLIVAACSLFFALRRPRPRST